MRIGLLTGDLTDQHGWGSYSLNLIRALAKTEHQLTIVTAHNSPPLDDLHTHAMLPDVSPPEGNFLVKLLAAYPRVASLVRDCDVIHTTVELYAPLLLLLGHNRPTVMTAHGSYINLPRVRRFPVNHLYRTAYNQSLIICVSHYTGRIAREIIPNANITVVLNTIDPEPFQDIAPVDASHPMIVTLGGVKARKGTLELVEAVAVVRQQLADVRCHILGSITAEPGYVARVKRRIAQLQLDQAVILHGFVSDDALRDWYAKADVFALPSINAGWKFEGFGLATLEASAAGLPVIGTRDCGAEDAIDDGITGLLVSQERIADELPDALLQILTDRQHAYAMGQAGRDKALSYTWDDVATQVIQAYQASITG